MKICALTMVHRDHWALSRWHAHFARELGAENLFVVAHGPDPEIGRLCPGASVITVPRDRFDNFDRDRAALLNGIMAGLLAPYDAAIRSDADELVCHDPDRHASLRDAIAATEAPVLTALGFDLVEQDGDAPLSGGPVLGERRALAFSGHYSKACIARRPVEFLLHGTRVAPRRLAGFPFVMPRGLYLAHLKYANAAALADGTAVRQAVASGTGTGLPGAGWKEAGADAARFRDTFAAKKPVPWETAEEAAFATLSVKPARLERHAVVKARALKMAVRTRLPDRFAAQG